jgi:hypothetical protein
MTDVPKITVLMNCFNGERFVREAIESVYAQNTTADWEIVFWDNESTDRTAAIAKSFDSRLRYFRSRENVPLGQARVWGLAEARGEWVTILDHDDMFLPSCFERQILAVGSEDYAMSYCGFREIDERGSFLRSVLPKEKTGWLLHHLLVDFEIGCPAAVMMRRDYLQQLSMDKIRSLKTAEDYYLYLGLAARGRVCMVPEVLAVYRQVSASLSEKMLAVQATEFHETLDELERELPGIQKRYEDGFRSAHARAEYAGAKYLMQVGRYPEGRKTMAAIRHMRRAYGALHLATYIPPLWHLVHRRSIKARLTHLLIGSGF